MEGYIKAHRKMLEWEHYTDITTFKLFFHLLFKANIKDKKYMGQIIPRGSLIFRENSIGDDCGLTYREVRTAINKLKNSEEITKKSTNKFSIITIVNYEYYQGSEQNNGEQATNKRRTNDELTASIEEEGEECKEYLLPENSSDEKKNTKTYSENSREMELSLLLSAEILKNNPAWVMRGGIQKWCDTFRLMLERDKRDYSDIASMIKFCQWNEFWKTNILSPAKLREKYDQLTLKREEARKKYEREHSG